MQQKAAAAAAHAAATASAAAAAAAAAAAMAAGGPGGAAAGHRANGAIGGGAAAGTGANSKASAATAAANSKLAATSEETAVASAAAAAAAKALPDPAVLAAVHAELQHVLGVEAALLQQRLGLLGSKANSMVEEVTQLHGATHSQMAEQAHRRYVQECSAVAALERVVKAAAAAGQPLAHDLRLEVSTPVV